MDFKDILLIIAFVLDIGLAIFVYLNNRRRELNITYSLMALWTGLWTLGIAIFRTSGNYRTQLFWNQEFIVTAALIASSFLHFSFIFSESGKEIKLRNWQRFLIYIPTLIILWGVMTPGALIKNIEVRSWGNESILGWGYIYYGLYFGTVWLWGTVNLIRKYLKATGIFKAQLRYVLVGLTISVIFGATFNLIFILLGNYKWIWLGPYASFMFLVTTTYAIVRYRLMDIRIVARKIFIYLGVAIFTYAIFYLVAWIYIQFLGGVFSATGYLAGVIIAPIFVILFFGVNAGLKVIANKYFFVSLYNYQETINKLTDELNYYIDLNKIISLIVETIKKTMQLNRAGVLLINQNKDPVHYQIAKVVGFNEQNGISLVQDSFLTRYLQKIQKPLVRDELLFLIRDARNKKDQESFRRLYNHMKHIEASLCLPLMSSRKLIGIIVLGAKISGSAYTQEDLELLNTMSKQAGIAIENAMLYKQVQDFSKTLQGKVDEQTKDIRTKSGEIEEKNKYLKELLEMKSDFLRVVNHQLNTPLSVMNGFFSMMEEGSYPTEKALPSIKAGLERINSTVADFWDAYQLEGERMKMQSQKTDVTEIVDRLILEKQKMRAAQEKNITVKSEKPKFKVPVCWCDYKKIAHVISNLLDNAVFYTEHGSITVSYEVVGDNYLKVNIKDTGVGIYGEDKDKIFQKFSRGQKATDHRPDGSGLGLFIAKKIVEGNFGEISFYSEGKDKGTTFSFTLPIYKNQKKEQGDEDTVTREKNIVVFDENI